VSAPLTSSMGRLFDAVSAVAGLRDAVNYEGQAAVELEQRADPAEAGAYPAGVHPSNDGGGPLVIAGADLLRAVVDDLAAGTPAPTVAARFHNGVAAMVVDVARRLRAAHDLTTVALSGGVFQNVLLLERVLAGLRAEGFRVLTHHRVPTNDGGISLGQVAVAVARIRAVG
jgi:hydrogenase maturation protein HypF